MLEYRNKVRHLDVRTMDGHLHTLSVDDSLTVAELTKLFAESIGRSKSNHPLKVPHLKSPLYL